MPDLPNLVSAFLIGISGGLHCTAMCGGISGMLGYTTQQSKQRAEVFLFVLTYNTGRILSYTSIGFIAGGVSGWFNQHSMLAHSLLVVLSSSLLILIGIQVSGVWRGLAILEKLGGRLWQFIRPLAISLFPIKTPLKALAFGMVWGWLPCGLVYSTLAWSMTSAAPLASALLMAVFGLGTLPWLLVTTFGGRQLKVFGAVPILRQILAVILIATGGFHLFSFLTTGAHHHH